MSAGDTAGYRLRRPELTPVYMISAVLPGPSAALDTTAIEGLAPADTHVPLTSSVTSPKAWTAVLVTSRLAVRRGVLTQFSRAPPCCRAALR